MPYVDPQTWDERGFNDQLYLRVTGPAAFTHLEVRKSDILREFAFPHLGCPSSGAGPVVDLPDPKTDTPAVSTKGDRGKVPLVIKILAEKFPDGVPSPPEAPRKVMIGDLLDSAPALGGKLDEGTLKKAIDRYNNSLADPK